MKLLETPYGYYDITTRAHYEVNSYMDRAADLTEFRVWFVQVEHPECDHEGNQTHTRLTDNFTSWDDAKTELDRIAALIEGKATAQGWVAGPPPLVDGAWFLALDVAGQPVAVTYAIPKNSHPWETAGGNDVYCAEHFTHHLPTPIQPPKES